MTTTLTHTSAARRPNTVMRFLDRLRPTNADQLHRLVRLLFDMDVPRKPILPGSAAPFDYLTHAYFGNAHHDESHESHARGEPAAAPAPASDLLVWANRGGGKTALGAVATLLDMIYRPGIEIRILGGSLEQSSKMYEHLRRLLDQPGLSAILAGPPTQRRIVMKNASRVELLAQSHRSVRGTRVHKLRCDELDEFDADIWTAAQAVTRSDLDADPPIRGSIEAFSTMHRKAGVMSRMLERIGDAAFNESGRHVDPAVSNGDAKDDGPAAESHVRLFRWTALDVIARCEPQRPCESCNLWPDCRGRAKHAAGFIPVDDLVAQRARMSDDVWLSEMLCKRPRRDQDVYANFSRQRHVVRESRATQSPDAVWLAGMDPGLHAPAVFLWARALGEGRDAIVHIVDEHAARDRTLDQHLRAIAAKGHPRPRWIGIDPAANQRNAQTGLSDADQLRRAGYDPRSIRQRIAPGIDRVRRRLDRGMLLIHPRCTTLIAAMDAYHYDESRPQAETPVKDGPDHACDALRYLIDCLELSPGPASAGSYL